MNTDTPYYLIKPAVDTNETGTAFPAVESYEDYNFDAPNSVHKLKYGVFPDFVPDIRFKLAKGAKLCDMMGQATIAAHGFLVSENLKNIFEQYNNIVPHKYYPATIEDSKGVLYNYFWMHLVWDDAIKYINFPETIFIQKKASKVLGHLSIASYEDYLIKKQEIGYLFTIDFEILKLNAKPLFELFIVPLKIQIVVSKKMSLFLSESSLKGISIQPFEKLSL